MNSLEITEKRNLAIEKMQQIVNTCKTELREMTDNEKNEFNAAKEEIVMLKEELRNLKDKLSNYSTEIENVDKKEIENNNRNNTNTKMEVKEFRLLKAINDIANNRSLDEVSKEYVEKGANEMRKSGLSFTGQIQIPNETRAAIVVGSDKNTVNVETMTMLEAIRGRNILAKSGAKFMTGLIGDVQVPVLTGAQVAWEGETDAAADGNASIKSVKLSPKRLSCYVDVSKQFLIQDSSDAESVLRQDLINAINAKLEQTILGTGAGSATEPKGLFTGSPTVADTFEKLVNLEATIDGTNILNQPVYILSNEAKAKFRCTPKSSTTVSGSNASAIVAGGLVYEMNEIDGVPAYNSSNVAANMFAYGDFSNLAIAQWGAIDLIVDPYTKAAEGMIRLVINAYFDIQVLRNNAIAVGKIK